MGAAGQGMRLRRESIYLGGAIAESRDQLPRIAGARRHRQFRPRQAGLADRGASAEQSQLEAIGRIGFEKTNPAANKNGIRIGSSAESAQIIRENSTAIPTPASLIPPAGTGKDTSGSVLDFHANPASVPRPSNHFL
jgi:hypothetical protein